MRLLGQWVPPQSTSPYPAGSGNDDWWQQPVGEIIGGAGGWLEEQITGESPTPAYPIGTHPPIVVAEPLQAAPVPAAMGMGTMLLLGGLAVGLVLFGARGG